MNLPFIYREFIFLMMATFGGRAEPNQPNRTWPISSQPSQRLRRPATSYCFLPVFQLNSAQKLVGINKKEENKSIPIDPIAEAPNIMIPASPHRIAARLSPWLHAGRPSHDHGSVVALCHGGQENHGSRWQGKEGLLRPNDWDFSKLFGLLPSLFRLVSL